MDFDLDEDERALQDGVREWCRGRAGSTRIRATEATGGVDRDLFAELAAQGVLGLCAPEGAGGMGLGATHATVVFEELGRALVPGPVVATHLAAGLVDGAVQGTTVVTDRDAGATVLVHPVDVDHVVVVDGDGLWLQPPPGVTPTERPFDPLTPVASVPSGRGDGQPLGGPDEAVRWRRWRTLLTSAQLLGSAAGSTDLAVTHAGQREQFGRVIGSFQAIKHLCSDALARAELARAAVYAAACHLDGRAGDDASEADLDAAVATAALLAGEAAVRNAKTCIQVHGGMGFTWEVDAHLHLKRATVWAARVGGSHHNADRVAATL